MPRATAPRTRLVCRFDSWSTGPIGNTTERCGMHDGRARIVIGRIGCVAVLQRAGHQYFLAEAGAYRALAMPTMSTEESPHTKR